MWLHLNHLRINRIVKLFHSGYQLQTKYALGSFLLWGVHPISGYVIQTDQLPENKRASVMRRCVADCVPGAACQLT